MTRVTVESSLSLPIHRLVMDGARKGWSHFAGTWVWTRTLYSGERVRNEIDYRVRLHADGSGVLELVSLFRGERVEQTIYLDAAPRHYGGVQWYAECPRTGDRASKLYLPPGARLFLSRRAYRLAYAIQNESRLGRHCARRWALIRGKLKSDDAEGWEKPKWMRWRTFDRITEEIARHDEAWGCGMSRKLDRLAGRLSR